MRMNTRAIIFIVANIAITPYWILMYSFRPSATRISIQLMLSLIGMIAATYPTSKIRKY